MSTDLSKTDDRVLPVADPGIEPHLERWTDADPATGKKAYREVVTIFGLVPVLAIAFVVIYFAVPKTASAHLLGTFFMLHPLLLGLTGGLATLLVGVGAVHWARTIMSDTEIAEDRHDANSPQADRVGVIEQFQAGAKDSGMSRRGLIGASLGGALGILAVPALVTLADMGPWPTAATRKETIEKTIWAEGVLLVNDVNQKKLRPEDLEIGQLVNAQPETLWDHHGTDFQVEKAKASIIIVRMDPASIKIPESRKDWQVGGILCYSKICTHVGCPISLWERQTHHLLCPCHQSTFDLGDSGVVVFGPAARALPQLPIAVNSDGYLVAKSEFKLPVGPIFFERDSRNDFKEGDR